MTINIRWEESGGGHVTKVGGEVAVVRAGAGAAVLQSIAPPPTIVIALLLSITIVPPSIAITASANR